MSDNVVFLDMPKTRVYLRPPEKRDVPFYRQSMNKEGIARFLRYHNPVLEYDEEQWLEGLSKKNETNKLCAIVLKEGHETIGSIGLHEIDWISRTATTGTFIGREDLLGKGLGTEAKMLWLKYAFLGLNLRQIYSRVHAFNGRSAAYAKKCGYREIAQYPDHVFRDGEYHDLIHFLVTLNDWKPLWQEFEKKMKGESNVS